MNVTQERLYSQKYDPLDYFRNRGPTPLFLEPYSELNGSRFLRKCETENVTGAFKERGAMAAGMRHIQDNPWCNEFVTASAGNHGQGVALAAQKLGVAATVFVPYDTPQPKIEGMIRLGARISKQALDFEEASKLAYEYNNENTTSHFIHPFDDPDVIRGQGTIGDELIVQLAGVRHATIVVPVGGGGLLAGIAQQVCEHNAANYLRPGDDSYISVVGASVENSDSAALTYENSLSNLSTNSTPDGSHFAFRTNSTQNLRLQIQEVYAPNKYIDGTKVTKPGNLAAEAIVRCVDGFITVPTLSIAQLVAAEHSKNAHRTINLSTSKYNDYSAEPAGLLAKAGALTLARNFLTPQTYVFIDSGSNYSPDTMQALVDLYNSRKCTS